MRSVTAIFLILLGLLSACRENKVDVTTSVIASGQMPNIAKDSSGNIHLVYGNGDSILYSWSSNNGKTFSTPGLVAILPKLAASSMRGPQIAATASGVVITACNNPGDIFSFTKGQSGKWLQATKVNDTDTTAKENLMALSADGDNAFAVWLDLRDGHNEIFGAKSTDGGKTWSKNIMVYASPDSTVCECCKPSVAIRGNNVYVMFRNWLNGNRDLYLVQSVDGGTGFGQAQKLGSGSWALSGCPMDGGGLVIAEDGKPQTVWNRRGEIYACEAGKPENLLGKGRSCAIESVNSKNIYAWVEEGKIVILKPAGGKLSLGEGQLPVIRAINSDRVLCIWENDKHIYKSVTDL